MNERENARFNELNKKDVRSPEEDAEHKDLQAKKGQAGNGTPAR